MGKRETFSGALSCACGSKGQGMYEENENPAHNNWNLETKIISVSELFSLKSGKISCNSCGENLKN